jgi:hypothetical protein
MHKIILFLLLLLMILPTTQLFPSTHTKKRQDNTIQCSPQLQSSLRKIQSLDEGKQLLSEILKSGPLRISTANVSVSQQFGACWDSDRRIIYVSLSAHNSREDLIGSLIFELYNALNSATEKRLSTLASKGKIDKKAYVRGIEYMEYQNSLQAAKLAELGIQKGLFPKSALMPIYNSFDVHFYYQQVSGHSAVIAKNYDYLRT